MRLFELASRKKKPIPVDPRTYEEQEYERGYDLLQSSKERGIQTGERLKERLQLFVPRSDKNYFKNKKEYYDSLLSNEYAWNDDGTLKPEYQNILDKYDLTESAPILFGKLPTPPGRNKPNCGLWTSTAKKLANGKWTSDWQNFALTNGLNYSKSPIGYLYKIKPPTCILDLITTSDCEQIYKIFNMLRRGNTKFYNQGDNTFTRNFPELAMAYDFPWPEIAKHFDGIHHWGRRVFRNSGFLDDWDVESTAWFNTNCLEFLGQVPVITEEEDTD